MQGKLKQLEVHVNGSMKVMIRNGQSSYNLAKKEAATSTRLPSFFNISIKIYFLKLFSALF